jgi:hypothetical protein
MWVIVLEAMVALGMLLLIVWLTMGGRHRDPPQELPPDQREGDSDPK